MATQRKQKSGRGIPRKAGNAARKRRHEKYWDRATCVRCHVIFRSPKIKNLHMDHNHEMTVAGRVLPIQRKIVVVSSL